MPSQHLPNNTSQHSRRTFLKRQLIPSQQRIPAPFLCCLHLAKHLCRTSLPNAINFEEQAMAFGRADDDRKVCLSFTEILTGRQMGSHFWTCAAFRGARYWFFNHKATKHPWITSDLCMSLRVQSQSRKWPENSNPVHPLLRLMESKTGSYFDEDAVAFHLRL